MKNIIVNLLFIILPISISAQYNYSFDFVAGVDRNSNTFLPHYSPQYNLRIGGNFNFKFRKNIVIKTGLRYAELGLNYFQDSLRWPSQIGPDGFDPTLGDPEFLEASIRRRYIELPIMFRYQMGGERISAFFEAGLSPHFYINTKRDRTTDLWEDSESIDETDMGLRRVRNALVFSFGVNYNVSRKLQLFAQPVYRSFTSSHDGLRDEHRNFGLEAGIRKGLYVQKSDSISK